MIYTTTIIKRGYTLELGGGGATFTDKVKNYKKELMELMKFLDQFYLRRLPINEEYLRELQAEIKRELD